MHKEVVTKFHLSEMSIQQPLQVLIFFTCNATQGQVSSSPVSTVELDPSVYLVCANLAQVSQILEFQS